METIGRDKISQTGNESKLKIDNRQSQNHGWLTTLILAIIGGVIVAGVVYWIGWN